MLVHFLISFISIFVKLLYWAILIHVLMSWFASTKSPLGDVIERVVHPVLMPFRWARIGMIDLSPILALFALSFIGDAIQELLYGLLA